MVSTLNYIAIIIIFIIAWSRVISPSYNLMLLTKTAGGGGGGGEGHSGIKISPLYIIIGQVIAKRKDQLAVIPVQNLTKIPYR